MAFTAKFGACRPTLASSVDPLRALLHGYGGLAEFGGFSSRDRPVYCWCHANAVPIERSDFRWRRRRAFCNIVTIVGRGDEQTNGVGMV